MRKYLGLLLGLIGLGFAHPGHLLPHTSPFTSGLLHPLTGIDHMAVMVAVGMLGAYFSGRKALIPPLTFVSAMTIGFLLGFYGLSLGFVEQGILLSVTLSGLLLLFRSSNLLFLLPVVGLFAIFHGLAHGYEAPHVSALSFGLGFILSTFTLHITGITLGKLGNERMIKASGLAMVALSLLLVVK